MNRRAQHRSVNAEANQDVTQAHGRKCFSLHAGEQRTGNALDLCIFHGFILKAHLCLKPTC